VVSHKLSGTIEVADGKADGNKVGEEVFSLNEWFSNGFLAKDESHDDLLG
jgi:hypothetical protein